VGYQAELRHSQPDFTRRKRLRCARSSSYGAVHLTIHPCGKPQGILAKANKGVENE